MKHFIMIASINTVITISIIFLIYFATINAFNIGFKFMENVRYEQILQEG
jgi:hypothetical protein